MYATLLTLYILVFTIFFQNFSISSRIIGILISILSITIKSRCRRWWLYSSLWLPPLYFLLQLTQVDYSQLLILASYLQMLLLCWIQCWWKMANASIFSSKMLEERHRHSWTGTCFRYNNLTNIRYKNIGIKKARAVIAEFCYVSPCSYKLSCNWTFRLNYFSLGNSL